MKKYKKSSKCGTVLDILIELVVNSKLLKEKEVKSHLQLITLCREADHIDVARMNRE